MKTKIHAAAGVIGFLTILSFWTSTLYSELFTSHETIAAVKALILKGMFILIPAMMIAGGSGMAMGKNRTDALAVAKKRRMPIIALNGLVILLPSAWFLAGKAAAGEFDTIFYVVQALELCAGAANLTMLGLNIRDGLTMTGRISGKANNQQTQSDGPVIDQRDGGPLVAKNVARIVAANGTPIETKTVAALCRCGASKNKPFCDGTHNEIGFDSSRSNNRTADELKAYEGKDITVYYNRLLCSHAGVCGKRLKPVFDSSRKPWIEPDNASSKEIISVVGECPSGALSYALNGEKPRHEVLSEQGIVIEKNGPYQVAGIPLNSSHFAEGACPDKYVLCRCGASQNKPFCDGTHQDIDWQDNEKT